MYSGYVFSLRPQQFLCILQLLCHLYIWNIFFYISIFFRLLFSSFSNRLGETKFTDLSFSVTNLHFSITNLHFSGRLQILREILSSIFNKKDNCPSRDLNQGWLDHKQLSYPLYHTGVMKSRLRNIDNKDYIFFINQESAQKGRFMHKNAIKTCTIKIYPPPVHWTMIRPFIDRPQGFQHDLVHFYIDRSRIGLLGFQSKGTRHLWAWPWGRDLCGAWP